MDKKSSIMKTIRKIMTLAMAVAMSSGISACRQAGQGAQKAEGNDTKTLVAYFSATGTTARAAQRIANETGGELHEIAPAEPYTAADLDWHDELSRSTVEMKDPKSRPAIKADSLDMAAYDVVYIGYPIWWGVAPRVINTFIESHDLKGKRIVPFATSGGSGVDESVDALKASYPELDIETGRLMND